MKNMRDRTGSNLVPVLLVSVFLLALLFFLIQPSQSVAQWVEQARLALAENKPLPTASFGPGFTENLHASMVGLQELGVHQQELLRCRNLVLATGTRIGFGSAPAEARIVFSRDASNPLILPWSGDPIPEMGKLIDSLTPATMERNILASLASSPDGLAQPVAALASRSFLSHLRIKTVSPGFQTLPQDMELARVLGPIHASGRFPPASGTRLAENEIVFQKDASRLPQAGGIYFEGLKLAPAPQIDWDAPFKALCASNSDMKPYANLWTDRQNLLATWVPKLCDEVGNLLSSGFMRFNRPDVLPSSASLLSPMDEVHLLRAFFTAGLESARTIWYPREYLPGSAPADPFSGIPASFARTFDSPEAVKLYLASTSGSPFDRIVILTKGDLEITGLVSTGALWLGCAQGSLTVRGDIPTGKIFLAARGGNVRFEGQGNIPHVICLKDASGNGGSVILKGPTAIKGLIRAETLELQGGGTVAEFRPDPFPQEDRLPLVIQKN